MALAASICWGFENNTTRQLSAKNPVQTVMVKGFGSGSLSLCVAAYTGQIHLAPGYILGALLLGALAYGCSVYFYILAQRYLGAACTGVFYAAAPFMGVLFSFMLIGQPIGWSFCTALALMLAGTWLAAAGHVLPPRSTLKALYPAVAIRLRTGAFIIAVMIIFGRPKRRSFCYLRNDGIALASQ